MVGGGGGGREGGRWHPSLDDVPLEELMYLLYSHAMC